MDSIIVEQLSKSFFIKTAARPAAFKNNGSVALGKNHPVKITALDNLSFTVKEGEKLAVIGLNGSGKTTLLRLIAGLYRPDGGAVRTNGPVIAFIDLAWPRLRLSVRDNIFLGGALFGLSAKEIQKILPSIIEFAELSAYLRAPMYQLSAGMQERLTIAAILGFIFSSRKRIIIIDELFANGDIGFINKTVNKFEEFFKTNVTLLITGHNFDFMINKCDRIIWLDKGKIIKIGDSQKIIKEFLAVNGSVLGLRKKQD